MKQLTIAVDVDGTVLSDRYPSIGILRNHAKKFINKWYAQGHKIIINTCRSGEAGAIIKQLLIDNGIKFHYFNEHDPKDVEIYDVESRKISADVYIDDKNSEDNVDWPLEDRRITDRANRKPLILAIVGESGSGKTTLAEHIEREFGIVMIESYTSRPVRHKGETGHTFCTPEEFERLDRDDMLALTQFGDFKYCCLGADLRDRNTYVIDEGSCDTLDREKYNVVSIRAYCTKKELERRVGKERSSRDKGKFSYFRPWMYWISKFDYYVNTSKTVANSEFDINMIIKEILNDYKPL